ncbi:MaoC family dehydratase N-terminal domain-containing protein, partial [Haematobacter sp.]|uniref:FAS1-like dehydratase domain-containing protein n=2 Tax=unclassified Haematobacter TaxID=2640585 RepID=UPI003918277D
MSVRLDRLLAHDFGRLERSYDARDTILYALGCGAGAGELPLVCERGLVALPSMATVLCNVSDWLCDPAGLLDGTRALHGSERIELDGPLPASGRVTAAPRIAEVHDKGEGRGAIVVVERDILDAATGARLARVTNRVFFRGDGGIGGTGHPAPVP